MRRMRYLASLFSLCLGCGGAAEPIFLQPGGPSPESGASEAGAEDVSQALDASDASEAADVAVDMHVMESSPPVDTGPPDTGPSRPPITCGATTCELPGNECCANTHTYPTNFTCQSTADSMSCLDDGNTPILCSSPADCPGGVCCGTKSTSDTYKAVTCAPTCMTTTYAEKVTFCSASGVPDVCAPLGLTCMPSTILNGFYVCD
jgi:hypothetical protein